mgnify:CR=1 FL=1
MTKRRFKVLLEWDRQAELWVTYVPALDHLSTFGATREEALANTREAIAGYIEAAKKDGLLIPLDDETEMVDVEVAVA